MNSEAPLAGYGTHLRRERDELVARVEELETALQRAANDLANDDPKSADQILHDILDRDTRTTP